VKDVGGLLAILFSVMPTLMRFGPANPDIVLRQGAEIGEFTVNVYAWT